MIETWLPLFRWSNLFVIAPSRRYNRRFISHSCPDIELHGEDPWSFSPCPSGPLECWITRSMSWFPRDLRSDWLCHRLLRRVAGRFVGVDMDVALPSITHSSHRTSIVVHFHVRNSVCVPPLRFPLCTERSELGVALNRIHCRYVSTWRLRGFCSHLICLACCVYIIEAGYAFNRPQRRNQLFHRAVLVFTYSGIDGEWRGACLGFGDFLSYNLMVLLALPPLPSSSTTTQLWITVGSMISIAIGYSATIWLRWTYQISRTPGVPLPVMTYTAYVLLLDVIRDNPSPCSIVPRWWTTTELKTCPFHVHLFQYETSRKIYNDRRTNKQYRNQTVETHEAEEKETLVGSIKIRMRQSGD